MTTFYLMRHGEDKDNAAGILNGRRDEHLTMKGIQQAKTIAQKIKDSNLAIDVIYTSPLLRAVETANIVADKLNLVKPIILNDLVEREFGVMTGKPVNLVEKLCTPKILKIDGTVYFFEAAAAETFPQLKIRARLLLNKLSKRHSRGKILLVSHGDCGKMIYAAFYHLNWRKVLSMFYFDNGSVVELSKKANFKKPVVFKSN